ncbi:MAG: SufE family protein [Planctomycetes bacterium]|nr:SufE family protein [Planctomycetota bacterium]
MSILQTQARLVAEFQAIPDWEERYKRIIAMARDLQPMPEAHKVDENKVRGCSSTVWLHADFDGERITYEADSDAVLVRGLVALLLAVYSGHTPDEVLNAPPEFIEEMGLNAHLSPNRASGLTAMVRQIQLYAMAFKAKSDRAR